MVIAFLCFVVSIFVAVRMVRLAAVADWGSLLLPAACTAAASRREAGNGILENIYPAGASSLFAASAGAGGPFCGSQDDGITTPGSVLALYLDLTCPLAGDKLAAIDFASYGTPPQGSCGSYEQPSCTAENTTEFIAAECVGQPACRVWPNTTTFGDPCFGVKKVLVVQARCTSGPGSATPGCDATQGSCPSPPPPPPAPAMTNVVVDWTAPIGVLATEPSLQVVAHGLLMRDSPFHDKLFGLLRDLGARLVRYVPWLPTPLLGVAELEPPTAASTSWDFTRLDEQFLDTWDAVQQPLGGGNVGDAMIPNFSTPPTWLYVPPCACVRICCAPLRRSCTL